MECVRLPTAVEVVRTPTQVESDPMAGSPYGARPAAATSTLSPAELEKGRATLRACFAQYRVRMLDVVRKSLAEMHDLFDTNTVIPDGEVEAFRKKLPEWLDKFDRALCDLFERRVMEGVRRQGRRPDADASLATLRVLTAYDHDRQEALKDATRFLDRFTQREIAALDLRVEMLLGEKPGTEGDNPFGISYILDAVGSSARAVYPEPRVWRPFMERVLGDLTPEINKLYVTLNRFLADRGVLPEIKAALRARSAHRPQDDRDLLKTFGDMLEGAAPGVPQNVVVPEITNPNAAPPLVFADKSPVATVPPPAIAPGQEMSAAKILASLAALANATPAAAPGMAIVPGIPGVPMVPAAPGAPMVPGVMVPMPGMAAPGGFAQMGVPAVPMPEGGFPSLDPLMALGTSTPLFSTLARWQRIDLPAAIAQAAPPPAAGSTEGTLVPINLIPHIRAAIDKEIGSDTDRITMDVIALLFDYVFRDPSIPDAMRRQFARLQVPIVKAALLDRLFFSDKAHPARQLLDNLADAAVGSTNDDAYQRAFGDITARIIDDLCRDYDIDAGVFREANAKLAAFMEAERERVDHATTVDVEAALEAETNEVERSAVRVLLRDRLAGSDLPNEVRGFVETTWADWLTQLRREHGAEGAATVAALQTLDDLLWSIVAKERSAQKARLTKMIPSLITGLRKGATAVGAPPERSRAFFEALYQLHIAAIKAAKEAPPDLPPGPATRNPVPVRDLPPIPKVNVHDYVNEMPVGTWLAFAKEGATVNARLTWVSPLRTKYLFTSRSRARAFMYTPEELAYEIGAGQVALVVEPVPLFDRAVSAALDSLGARQPPAPVAA